MYYTFALLVTAAMHEPTPDDIHRFGFDVRPVGESPPRLVWNDARFRVAEMSLPISAWMLNGREDEYREAIADQRWRERVWDAVDDMARECCSWENRLYAARRLKEKIGPVAYYLGQLPASQGP